MEDQTKTNETGTSLSFTTAGSNEVDVEEEEQTMETGTTLCFTTAESNKVDMEEQTETVDIADQNLQDGSTALQQGVRVWQKTYIP